MAEYSSFSSEPEESYPSGSDSSDNSDISSEDEQRNEGLGIQPYMYEPEIEDLGDGSPRSTDSDSEDEEHAARLGNNDWYTFNHSLTF